MVGLRFDGWWAWMAHYNKYSNIIIHIIMTYCIVYPSMYKYVCILYYEKEFVWGTGKNEKTVALHYRIIMHAMLTLCLSEVKDLEVRV